MEHLRTWRRRVRPTLVTTVRAAAALTATLVLLAACGGDGAGGGTTDKVLHALIVNASPEDVTVSYTGAEPAEDVTQATCTSDTHNFPLSDPFSIAINGETVLDTDVDLPEGLPNFGESDLIVRIDVAQDGSLSFDRVRPGSGIQKPSKAAYCPQLPS